MPLPLDNIRVLDLTRAAAGPFCTMILADFGADVVKVEPLPNGDLTRLWGPYDHDIGVYYLSINRNKRGLGVDFRNEAGLEAVRRMAARADVVVENFKPGTTAAMGPRLRGRQQGESRRHIRQHHGHGQFRSLRELARPRPDRPRACPA